MRTKTYKVTVVYTVWIDDESIDSDELIFKDVKVDNMNKKVYIDNNIQIPYNIEHVDVQEINLL